MNNHTHTWTLYSVVIDENKKIIRLYVCSGCGAKGKKE